MIQRSQECVADLGDMLIDARDRPLFGLNGRQHIDMYGAASENFVSLGRNVTGVMDDDRHDGDTGLNRHVEAALFKCAQFARWSAGALGCYNETFLFLLHRPHQRLHGFDSCLPIAAINEHHTCRTHQRADHRQVFQLSLADAHNISPDQAGHDQHVRVTLVVEHENSRTLFPDMFAASHINIQSD